MSFRWMVPRTTWFSATSSGVPPLRAMVSTCAVDVRSRPHCRRTTRRRSRRRPCGCCHVPRSTPLMRVSAVNGTNVQSPPSARLGRAEPPRQGHDRASLGGLVGAAGEVGGAHQLLHRDARRGKELGRLPVAERDRSGLVEQQRVDVAGRLDRAARHGEDVLLEQAIDAGDADGAEQAADGRRDEADEQRDQHRDRDRGAGEDRDTAAA